jgi:hypothetical protein
MEGRGAGISAQLPALPYMQAAPSVHACSKSANQAIIRATLDSFTRLRS